MHALPPPSNPCLPQKRRCKDFPLNNNGDRLTVMWIYWHLGKKYKLMNYIHIGYIVNIVNMNMYSQHLPLEFPVLKLDDPL